jgi:hypothetical protein
MTNEKVIELLKIAVPQDESLDEEGLFLEVIDMAIAAFEQNLPLANSDLIQIIEKGIKATGTADVYSVGMCNGMRWCKSLLDGKEPEYDTVQQKNCEGCKHLGKWENEIEYGYSSPCTRCKRRAEDHYEKKNGSLK